MDKAKSSFNIERGYKNVNGLGGGGGERIFVCGWGLLEIGKVEGRA